MLFHCSFCSLLVKVPSKARGNDRALHWCFQKNPGDNALILNLLALPMVTSVTFRKLANQQEKWLEEYDKENKTRTPKYTETTGAKRTVPDKFATTKIQEYLRKMMDNPAGIKAADLLQVEALLFTATMSSDDGADERPKTVLDDILGCLMTACEMTEDAAQLLRRADQEKDIFKDESEVEQHKRKEA